MGSDEKTGDREFLTLAESERADMQPEHVNELPANYRWATSDETEAATHSGDFSGMVQVRQGGTDDEPQTDLAVPEKTGVYGIWWGGDSYAMGTNDDLEYWESEEDAKEALLDRYAHGHWSRQYFGYVNKDREYTLTPAVNESTNIQLFTDNPENYEYGWTNPDYVLTLEFGEDDKAFVVVAPC